jgi:hypothetical protein
MKKPNFIRWGRMASNNKINIPFIKKLHKTGSRSFISFTTKELCWPIFGSLLFFFRVQKLKGARLTHVLSTRTFTFRRCELFLKGNVFKASWAFYGLHYAIIERRVVHKCRFRFRWVVLCCICAADDRILQLDVSLVPQSYLIAATSNCDMSAKSYLCWSGQESFSMQTYL